jgi:hypothetical protein
MKDNGFWVYYVKGEFIRYPNFTNYSSGDRGIKCHVCHVLPHAGFMPECDICNRKFVCASTRNGGDAER